MVQDKYGVIFSKRVRELRRERNMTIEQFANAVGISKSSVGYYESRDRVPDIVIAGRMAEVLGVTADYLIGRSDARTKEPKLKSVCDKVGLSDKSVMMLARLKEENVARLRILNMLLEQADDDIGDDYELEGNYEGSVLNAVCRYLDRYRSADEFVAEYGSSSDEGISSAIQSAVYRLILDQAVDAMKNLACSDTLADALFRGDYYDEGDD
ncbi:MAG: helix-turn-helix transcriptional regulator [Lachnospiraceae bacterium]|nr:helix-turn-helix transcriptional regulator [Lachnospiraceae bacterium]